jgi:transcriptional regulator with XRE-family HTH domain
MKKRKLSKKRLAELMNVSRAQLDRILTALVTRCPLQFKLQSKRSHVPLLARSPAPRSAGFIKALFPNWSH